RHHTGHHVGRVRWSTATTAAFSKLTKQMTLADQFISRPHNAHDLIGFIRAVFRDLLHDLAEMLRSDLNVFEFTALGCPLCRRALVLLVFVGFLHVVALSLDGFETIADGRRYSLPDRLIIVFVRRRCVLQLGDLFVLSLYLLFEIKHLLLLFDHRFHRSLVADLCDLFLGQHNDGSFVFRLFLRLDDEKFSLVGRLIDSGYVFYSERNQTLRHYDLPSWPNRPSNSRSIRRCRSSRKTSRPR